jgi:hypothetical protein
MLGTSLQIGSIQPAFSCARDLNHPKPVKPGLRLAAQFMGWDGCWNQQYPVERKGVAGSPRDGQMCIVDRVERSPEQTCNQTFMLPQPTGLPAAVNVCGREVSPQTEPHR